MNDKKRLLIMGVLVVVLIGVMTMEQQSVKRRKAERAAQRAAAQEQEAAPQAESSAPSGVDASTVASSSLAKTLVKLGPRDEAMIQRQLERMELDWGRNPFELASDSPTSRAGLLTLRGLSLTDGGRGFVIINESILREGDVIDGNQVVRIEPSQVVLKKDGREFTMRLEELE